MLDDTIYNICNGKHYGPVLHSDDKVIVMRCSFCNKIFQNSREKSKDTISNEIVVENSAGKVSNTSVKNSKLCIQVCDWQYCGATVICNSCNYSGPIP